MKILIMALVTVYSSFSLAALDGFDDYGAIVLKKLSCTGATLVLELEVAQEQGGPATVAWKVTDQESGRGSRFMGYLFAEGSLKEFSSTDLGSSVEVSGSVAVVSFDDKEETLVCAK